MHLTVPLARASANAQVWSGRLQLGFGRDAVGQARVLEMVRRSAIRRTGRIAHSNLVGRPTGSWVGQPDSGWPTSPLVGRPTSRGGSQLHTEVVGCPSKFSVGNPPPEGATHDAT